MWLLTERESADQLLGALHRLGAELLRHLLAGLVLAAEIGDHVAEPTAGRVTGGPVVRVDEQSADPVVELADHPVALVGQEPARLGRGGHRVVGRREGDLVDPLVAELGVPVAGLGSAGRTGLRPLVRSEKDDHHDDPGDHGARRRQAHRREPAMRLVVVLGDLDGGDDPEELDDRDIDQPGAEDDRDQLEGEGWVGDHDEAGEQDPDAAEDAEDRALRMAPGERDPTLEGRQRIDLLRAEPGGGGEDQREEPDSERPREEVPEHRVPACGRRIAEEGIGDLRKRERPSGDQDDQAEHSRTGDGECQLAVRPRGDPAPPRSSPRAGSARGTEGRSRECRPRGPSAAGSR